MESKQNHNCLITPGTQVLIKCCDRQPEGWAGGAKVLGKLPVSGRPTNLDYSRARAYCACSRCGWGWRGVWTFFLPPLFLSPSLWETARYRLKYCLKEPLSLKQQTNQRQAAGAACNCRQLDNKRWVFVFHDKIWNN